MPRPKQILGPTRITTAVIPVDLYQELFPKREDKIAVTINEGLRMVAAARRAKVSVAAHSGIEDIWGEALRLALAEPMASEARQQIERILKPYLEKATKLRRLKHERGTASEATG